MNRCLTRFISVILNMAVLMSKSICADTEEGKARTVIRLPASLFLIPTIIPTAIENGIGFVGTLKITFNSGVACCPLGGEKFPRMSRLVGAGAGVNLH